MKTDEILYLDKSKLKQKKAIKSRLKQLKADRCLHLDKNERGSLFQLTVGRSVDVSVGLLSFLDVFLSLFHRQRHLGEASGEFQIRRDS